MSKRLSSGNHADNIKMEKQGLNVSINELRELANELEKQTIGFNLELEEKKTIALNHKWLVDIINETPECSDTWKLK